MPELYEIKKSKFYSYIYEINSREEIQTLNEQLKKEHKKARHICYAYTFFENSSQNSGFNDDGEPSGTAGRPIGKAIEIKNINNIVVFVIRYFGGIKLGAGGLIRAYSKSAHLIIDKYIESKKGS
ncbi:IMPACT family protein [Mycoplasmopsis primatum]|uniref:IMPACT family protein n=1 Tax=Mycoplasmopsis primatum TaxID=55604 RepID=UPI0004984F77|nr:YigZ family protein [Mycoplasmopsis primatum]